MVRPKRWDTKAAAQRGGRVRCKTCGFVFDPLIFCEPDGSNVYCPNCALKEHFAEEAAAKRLADEIERTP